MRRMWGVLGSLALAYLAAAWERQQQKHANTAAARRYARQRRQLQQVAQLRVLVGWVELQQGTAASVAEAQALRQTALARRHGREQRGTGASPPHQLLPVASDPQPGNATDERAANG